LSVCVCVERVDGQVVVDKRAKQVMVVEREKKTSKWGNKLEQPERKGTESWQEGSEIDSIIFCLLLSRV
jgi:hypothetical protein